MPIGLCEFPHCVHNIIANLVLVVWFMRRNQKLNYPEERNSLGMDAVIVYLNRALLSRLIS
jgi:hypothetical protein